MKMKTYRHLVQYYETDRMGVTHHSNYVRWMEEARISVLKEIGWGYDVMEQNGIVSPVTSVECRYRKPTTFPDEVDIELFVEEIRGARMKITYLMKNVKDETVCEASSEHVFMDGKGKLLRPDRDCPELYEALKSI